MEKINLLFICRYNRFRSRVAEAYFNKINKNKDIEVKSAGLIKGSPLNPNTVKLAKKFGLNINGNAQGLSSDILQWQDITVIVANDVPPSIFDKNKSYGKKLIAWKIKDTKDSDKTNINKIIRKIIKKVDKLNKQLERGELK